MILLVQQFDHSVVGAAAKSVRPSPNESVDVTTAKTIGSSASGFVVVTAAKSIGSWASGFVDITAAAAASVGGPYTNCRVIRRR